jgi:tetratricopeptide (TPR) repeat protein
MPALTAQSNPANDLTGRLTEVALGYQRTLAANPRHPQSLVGMSLVALASRQPEAAVKMAKAAVEVAPAMTNAWVALGQAFKAAGNFEQSEAAYNQAIRLDGLNELAHLGLGELKIATGRPTEAVIDFELAIRRKPALVAAHLGLGNAFAVTGRFEEALQHYQNALDFRPCLPEAEFAAGFVLARMGRVKEAETRYRRALVRRPDFAAAWMNLGSLLREQGREVYAEAALLRAVELRPDLVAGWINLAMLERERHRPAEAEGHLRKALALNPDQVETCIAWCQFRAAERDIAGAWGWLRGALARDPDQPEAANMHGILLHTEGRLEEALVAFRKAESLGHHAAPSNRGNTLLDLGRMEEALEAHQSAVDLEPTHPGAQYNLALTQLRLGHWEKGWPAYEARWRFREVHRAPRAFTQPRWHGEPLNGRRILLHAEQGLGDTIQFCRYATLVVARGGYPILQVQPPAERLLRSLAVVRAGKAEVALLGTTPPNFDIECPLMSLPAAFETTVDTVPWPGAYLGADHEAIAEKREAFPDAPANFKHNPRAVPRSLRVGLAWAGNPRYKADLQRSIHLSTLLPVLRVPGITWISLQKGAATQQLSATNGSSFVLDGSSRDRDLAETAALVATLDLVITTDTSIAHLAGALGKPLWLLLPHLADWRWMQQSETTPWYPTAHLLRQPTPGDWSSVLNRTIHKLTAFQGALELAPHQQPNRSPRPFPQPKA